MCNTNHSHTHTQIVNNILIAVGHLFPGDILQLHVDKPWEFNATYPVRSIVLPFSAYGPCYVILHQLVKHGYFAGQLKPPAELLLIMPRLVMLAISLVMDLLVVRIAKNLHVNVYAAQWCYGTSYVLYVYFTRTFTNTFEAFLFTLLLYVCTNQSLGGHTAVDCASIAFIITGGIFNRPTFPAFALIPVCYWLLRDRQPAVCAFFRNAIQCAVFISIFSLLFIFCDTLYFRSSTIGELIQELGDAGMSLDKLPHIFVLTPLNFLLYNAHSSNLAVHGIHPHYTHLTLNLVLLFGPGAICLYYRLFTALLSVPRRTHNKMCLLLLGIIFFPILVLSAFPHQEARFLIPLLLPFSLLCGHFLFSDENLSWKFLKLEWLIFNILAALFFGFLHQGGVVPSIAFLQKYINGLNATEASSSHYEYHLLYYHTYPPPYHLFGRQHQSTTLAASHTHIHDLRGAPTERLGEELELLSQRNHSKILLVAPSTVRWRLCKIKHLKLTHLHSVWPHLSFEDPPSFDAMVLGSSSQQLVCSYDHSQQRAHVLSNLFHLLHLDIFFVSF